MKITKTKLKQIIKEEISRVLETDAELEGEKQHPIFKEQDELRKFAALLSTLHRHAKEFERTAFAVGDRYTRLHWLEGPTSPTREITRSVEFIIDSFYQELDDIAKFGADETYDDKERNDWG